MKSYFLIFLLLCFRLLLAGQSYQGADTSYVKITNESKVMFFEYKAVIGGQFIGGSRLKPGQTKLFKIPIPNSNVYRFVVYTDKKHLERHSIEPIDYFDQVSPTKVGKGTYNYFIKIPGDSSSMDVRLQKNE